MFFNKRIIVLIVLLFFLCFNAEAQCAICKQSAASTLDNDPNSVAKGLNSGILYLLALPYILVAIVFRKQLMALWKSWRGKEVKEEGN